MREPRAQGCFAGEADADGGDNAFVGIVALHDVGIGLFHETLHHVGVGVGHFHLKPRFDDALLHGGGGNGLGGGGLVGNRQSARSELHAAEVAHHDDKRVSEPGCTQPAENGHACRTRGLAVVVGAGALAVVADDVGVAHMARIVILLLVLRHHGLGFLLAVHVHGKSGEAAALLREVTLAGLVERQVSVGR